MNDEIPCEKDPALTQKIEEFSEILKSQAHKLDPFGMSEKDFYDSGIFEGSVQRVRGQISAAMGEKKTFVKHVLNHMQDHPPQDHCRGHRHNRSPERPQDCQVAGFDPSQECDKGSRSEGTGGAAG